MRVRGLAFGALSALLQLCLAACDDPSRSITGVRLAIRYGEQAPVWVYVIGETEDGRMHGAALLPDSPRGLAPYRETVLLELPPSLHGSVVMLSVTGFDERREPRLRGSVKTEVVRHTIQSALVFLTSEDASVVSVPDASAPTPSPEPDAAVPPDAAVVPDAADEPGTVVMPDPDPMIPADAGAAPEAGSGAPAPTPEPDAAVGCQGLACATPLICEEGVEGCMLECRELVFCALDCAGARDCTPRCIGAACVIECGAAERCRPTCEGPADCEIHCLDEESCPDVRCRAGARCLLHCADDDDGCTLECPQDGALECGDGVIACNRECPL